MTAEVTWLTALLRGDRPEWPFETGRQAIERVLETAMTQGVDNLCQHLLSGDGLRDELPAEFLQALRARSRHAVALELARGIELEQTLQTLADAALRPLIMKGTALAYTLYPSPHLRNRCDTDLLFLDRAAADRAWALLQESGYHRNNAVSGEFISQEFACYRTDGFGVGHVLDLHWKLNNAHYFADKLSFQELEAEAWTIPPLGPNARGLAPVHALLLACMHRIAHANEGRSDRLIWLYDLHLLASAFTETDWSTFQRIAAERGLSSIGLDGLLAARRAFCTDLPLDTMETLEASSASDWLTPARAANRRTGFISNLRALPDWRSRLTLLQEHLFPSAAYMLEKYRTTQTWRLPLLYLRRIFSGIPKHFR